MGIIKGLSFLSGRIGYKPIPKTACTSIKRAFYELEENREFSIENVGCDVHQYYEDQFVDKEGDRWFIDNGSMDTSASPASWNADEYGDRSYNWEYR